MTVDLDPAPEQAPQAPTPESETVDLDAPTAQAPKASAFESKTVDLDAPPPPQAPTLESMTVDLDALPARAPPARTYEVEELRKADPGSAQKVERKVEDLRHAVLSSTAGLDRGLSATRSQAQRVEEVVKRMEQSMPGVELTWVNAGKRLAGLQELAGVWRLVYSSAFLNGNLGGSRPGPPAGLVPFRLGPIYQRINPDKGTLDNIVEIALPPPPFAADGPTVRACLRHTFTVQGDNKVEIVYDSTYADVLNGEAVVQFMGRPLRLEPPPLQRLLPESLRSATFNVTFLGDGLRVTRGDRGELRVYIRDSTALGDIAIPDPDTNTVFSVDT